MAEPIHSRLDTALGNRPILQELDESATVHPVLILLYYPRSSGSSIISLFPFPLSYRSGVSFIRR